MTYLSQTYTCNNLANFQICSACNHRKRKLCTNLQESIWKKFVKSHQAIYFCRVFSHLEPLCGSGNINTGKSKVFSRSSSSAGVLSKQPQTSLKSSDSNASTSTSKSQPPHGSTSASRGHNSSATSSSGQPQ